MKKRILSLFLALTLCLTLLPTSAFAEGGDVSISGGVIGGGDTGGEGGGVLVPPGGSTGEGGGIYTPPSGPAEGGGGTHIPGEDMRTEIWCVSKPDSIGRSYDGTTDGGTIPIDLTFTDGTNEIKLKEGTDFTAKKTFDSADAGWHTVTVEIALIGEAAVKYKLKAGGETFTIEGTINRAYPDLTVSLSKTTCTVGETLLPLLSISGVQENAAVTYYYTQYQTIIGNSEYEGYIIPAIDENTAINSLDEEGNNTYYLYAKTAATKNYNEVISNVVELTVNEAVVEAASVTRADGTDGGTYESLPAALNAAQDSNGSTVKLLADVTTTSEIEVDRGTFTIDLNGKKWEGTDTHTLLVSGGNVTVTSTDGVGTITCSSHNAIYVDSGATVHVKSGVRLNQLYAMTNTKLTLDVGVIITGTFFTKADNIAPFLAGKALQSCDENGTLIEGQYKSIYDNYRMDDTGCVIVIEHKSCTGTPSAENPCPICGYDGTQTKPTEPENPNPDVAEVNGTKYKTLAAAIQAANGADITLLTIVTENVVVDGASIKASIILGNGKTIDDIPYPSNWVADRYGIPLTMEAGEITLKDGALAQFNASSSADVAIALKGGTLIVETTVTKIIGSNRSDSVQHAAIEATSGVLNLQGNTLLDGGLTMSGDAQLKSKLTAGTFTNSGSETYSVSVEGSSQYTTVFDLLETGYAFAVYNEDALTGDVIAKDTTTRELTEDVAVIKCTHKDANNKSLFKDNTCTGCGFTCAHETIENGICTVCNTAMGAQDNTGKYYLNLAEAFEGVADGGTVTMLTTLKDDDTISFCRDAEGNPVEKTVTLMMNGHSLSYEGTPSLCIESGKLIIGDEATISQPAQTAQPAVFVDNDEQSKDRGTLEFKGKANLTGGLLIQNWGKLVGGLKEGTIITSNGTYSVSVERSIDTYDNVLGLLGEGLAFAKYDESAENKAGALVDGSVKQLTEDVIVVAHTHSPKCTQNPDPDALQTYIYICDCGFVCPHDRFTNSICDICHAACTHDEYTSDDKCARCGAPFAVRVECTDSVGITSNKLYMKTTTQDGTDDTLRQVFNEAADGSTITLLANGMLPSGIYASKTLTLDLNGHSLDGYSLNVGGLTATNQVRTGKLTVIDSSGGNGAVGVTVRDGGTLVFDPENDSTTLLQLEVWGGIVGLYSGKILRSGLQLHKGIALGDLLPGNAGLAYYRGDTQLTLEEAASQTCDLVVKLCSHGGKNGFDFGATACPYCNAPAVAQTALRNVEGDPRRNFADLQTALDADRDGGSTLSLLTDVTGDYTINGTRDTGIDLNGHSIHGTVTVKAATGNSTTLSNTKNTTTASIDAVVAYRGAKLAGSGYPAVIGTLTLADTTQWKDILQQPTRLGFKVKNGDGTYKWYAPDDVKGSQLNNVIINSLPITTKTLNLKVDGKNLTGSNPKVERGTTVQLCASCNTKGADVYIYIGEIIGNNDPTYTYSQKKAEYKKIGSSRYYVVDLDANTIGSYDIYFTATKDGYSVTSSHKQLTVTKLNLSKAVITFPNGNESVYQPYNTTTGVPPYVVTYNGSELKAGVDYTVVSGDSRSTVGTATLTIKATDDGDYTGQKTARWTVAAHKATISVGDIIKVYDGTTDLPANASVKLKSADSRYAPSGGPLPLVAGEDYQILNASYDSANASEDEKTVSFTIKLTDRNYTFEDGTTQKDFVLNGADVSQTFKISQATVTPNEITQYVFNDLAKTYEIDLRTLLPELPVGCEYGKIHNRGCDYHFTDSTYLDSSNHIFVSNEGILTLPIVAVHSANVNDQIGTLTVPIVSTNYQPFELTIKVVIGQRIPLDQSGVSVSATDITYGQTLAESTLTATGSMICPRTQAVIPGTFAWKDGTIKPNAGSYDAEWTFTPAEGYEEYAPATGTVTVTVEPAELTGVSVRASSTYYTGKPQHASTIAFGQSVDGTTVTFTYSDKVDGDYTSDGPTFTDAGTYTVYYKAEAANHKTATGTFTVTIAPLPISLLSVERISKSYDGTANVTLTASRLTFFSKAANIWSIKLPDTALTFSDAQFTMKQADGSYLPSPDVGNGKALSFTMTLANDNYVLEREPEGTKTVSDTFATDDTTRFTITKAAAPVLTAYPVTRKYTLKTEQTIPLPDLKSLRMPDDAQVSDTNAFHSGSYSPAGKIEDGWGIDVNTGAITYTLAEGVAPGDVITFTLLVRSKNYEDAAVTVNLTLTERDTPILTLPDSITVDYTGAGIPVSAVTGKRAAFDGKDVPGTWSWKAGQTITNATDTGTKTIVFTPDDPVNYLPAEGTVSVTISPVAPAYTAPTAMDGLIYSGNAQALVNAGSTAHGKLLYSLSKDGAYSETVPTVTDAGEYTVWYKVAGDNNHTDTQPASVTVTVAPKTVTATVAVSGDSLTYTGDPLKPGVIVKDGDTVISPEEYDVSYRDNVNAGTATVTVRNKAGGNYTVSGSTTFEIGKAASDVRTAPGANTGLVYNGGEQTLVTTGTALGGKLKYRLGESGGFTEALPKAANAGTYTVSYMVEGDGNHRDSEICSLTVTIGKARVTVTALDKRIYTDDKAPDLSKPVAGKDYTVTGLFGEDALTGDITLTYVDASGTEITPDTTKVGKVIIRAGGLTAPNDNYTVVFADGKLTVDERPVYTVKATAGSHGSITPFGNVDVLHGGSQTFTIAANSGYAISNVKIDGVSIGAVKSYTFENVTENHTIEVTFMKANGNPQTGVMVDEVTGEYYVA